MQDEQVHYLDDDELDMIRTALRLRMTEMMATMKHVRGEYTKVHKAEYEAVRKLYRRLGGVS